ncbi:MAG: hypothetical protein ACYDDB_05975, partial [bacterium]
GPIKSGTGRLFILSSAFISRKGFNSGNAAVFGTLKIPKTATIKNMVELKRQIKIWTKNNSQGRSFTQKT